MTNDWYKDFLPVDIERQSKDFGSVSLPYPWPVHTRPPIPTKNLLEVIEDKIGFQASAEFKLHPRVITNTEPAALAVA